MKQILDFANIFIAMPCYLGYVWAVDKFCKNYFETTKRKERLFVVCLFMGWMLLHVVNECYAIPYIIFAIWNHIFFMGLVLLLFQADIEKKVVAASMLVAAIILVGNFSESFLSCVALVLLHTVKNIPEPFLDKWEICLIVYIKFAMVILVICGMTKQRISIFYSKMGKWHVMLAVPLLAITIVVYVANWGASNGILVKSPNMGLYYDQLFSHGEICMLSALSMFAAGFYVFGMDRIYLEQRKSSWYYSQVTAYKMLEEQYSQSERLRHDMKNHIIALQGLLEGREWEKMDDYLRKMEDSGSLGLSEDITGNMVVDAILYQKRKQAEGKNILWECEVQIPKYGINEFDLCVLFGNILDNAVEACERLPCHTHRFIHVQAKVVKKCFLMEVKNSTNITNELETGFTNKENPKEHGIGLLNVSDMVLQYHGVMNREVQDSVFVISILIPLNDAVHGSKQTS